MQSLSSNPVPEDEVEADDSQENIAANKNEALQCANLTQHFWMQQEVVDYEMISAIQTVKEKIKLEIPASSSGKQSQSSLYGLAVQR